MATDPAHPERGNEDFVGSAPGAAVVVDGAGIPGAEHLCRHGVAWYAHALGASLLANLSREGDVDLRAALATAISAVTDMHRDTCHVTHRSSPQAAVAAVRIMDGRLEHLLLADAYVVLDHLGTNPQVLTDPREVDLRRETERALVGRQAGSPAWKETVEAFRAQRNQPGGYWVAKDDPHAAAEAVVGGLTLTELSSVTLLSNGTARLVTSYDVMSWSQLIVSVENDGPEALLRRLRAAEADRPGRLAPDDASIAWWQIVG